MSTKQMITTVLDNDASTNIWPMLSIPLDEIHFDPEKNSRKFKSTDAEIRELANNIWDKGQLFPILVAQMPDDQRNNGVVYIGVDGERRYSALKLLAGEGNDVQVLARVMPSLPDLDAYELSALANDPRMRKEPSLMDQAYQAVYYRDSLNMTGKQIAEKMGKSAGWVSTALKFPNFRAAIVKKVHDGAIPWRLARVLVDLTEDEQDAALKAFEEAEGGKVTQIAGEHTKTKRKKKAAKGSGGEGGEGEGEGEGSAASTRTARAGLSAKKAIKIFTELAAVEKDEEGTVVKVTKAQEKSRELFAILGKFLAGRLGQKPLVKKVAELF